MRIEGDRKAMAHQERQSADDPADVETELIDLSDQTLDEALDMNGRNLTPDLTRTLQQVSRPRANLGGSGPPGRAD